MKYKRKPKTLWQRVWFKIRPQVIWHVRECAFPGMISYTDKDGRFWCTIKEFEANYEPVIAPIAPSKNELHHFGNLECSKVTNGIDLWCDVCKKTLDSLDWRHAKNSESGL